MKFIGNCVNVIFGAILILMVLYLSAKVMQTFSPLLIFAVAVIGTLSTFSSWKRTIVTTVGITIYLISWPTAKAWGTWPGTFIWAIGVSLWLGSVFWPVIQRKVRAQSWS